MNPLELLTFGLWQAVIAALLYTYFGNPFFLLQRGWAAAQALVGTALGCLTIVYLWALLASPVTEGLGW